MAIFKNILPDKGNFLQKLTIILKVLRLYIYDIALITLFAFAFLQLSQGVDVLVKTSENTQWFPGILVLLSLFFWVYVAWYSGRIITYLENDLFALAPGMLFHLPRIIGFYIYAVFTIAFLNKPGILAQELSGIAIFSLLVVYGLLYWQMNIWIRIGSVYALKKYGVRKFSGFCSLMLWCNILVIVIFGSIRGSNFSMIAGAGLLQFFFIFLVINRRRIRGIYVIRHSARFSRFLLTKVFSKAQEKIPRSEEFTFALFHIISLVSLIIYSLAIFNVGFSIQFGTLGIVLLAMGFYSGLFSLIKTLSVLYKINIIFFIILAMYIGGLVNEPHKVAVREVTQNHYDQRLEFKRYVYNWLGQHSAELDDDGISVVPVVFAHADGGASRSGYWTASVLSRLDSATDRKFSDHLFALSGASGGSVGNAVFYALLYLRSGKDSIAGQLKQSGLLRPAQDYLKTDFLTFTLARLLGPESVNLIYPATDDRARALERSIEYGAGEGVLLNRFFARPFSVFNTDENREVTLPVLCINTTRMQDGMPGVISNIKIDSGVFGRRLDVLSLLKNEEELRLSTAVVLGARFPYLSPAGCIIQNVTDTGGIIRKQKHYFVDGGYFDNSGAGVIQEMIMELEKLKATDPYLQKVYGKKLLKLVPLVVHITNTPYAVRNFKKVMPFTNDAAAPLLTLAGSYSSQTSVNDSRLKKYLAQLCSQQGIDQSGALQQLYYEINLYRNDTEEIYAMNWSISNTTLKRMQRRLYQNADLDTLVLRLKYMLH